MKLHEIPFLVAATPTGGGGGTPPEYIGTTLAILADGVLVKPDGTTASSTLLQCIQGSGMSCAEDTPPTGWTRIAGGAVQKPDGTSFGILMASGDVETLTLPGFGVTYRRVIAFNGTLRNVQAAGYYFADTPGSNPPSPSVEAEPGDMILSGFFQIEKNGSFSGTVEPNYNEVYSDDEMFSQGQVLMREGVAGGATGTIRHGMSDEYSAFYVFSASIGPSA